MKLEISRVGQKEEWVEFCVFEPCLRTNFETSANDLHHFLIRMDGKKLVLVQMECNGVQMNAQLKSDYMKMTALESLPPLQTFTPYLREGVSPHTCVRAFHPDEFKAHETQKYLFI
ncbi:hypothetical protein AVEN_34694-1 [Araneus ventricosus]|uniref:Uncharacterized protein n=1 Tax=Araneus ventricosus TaxID=182803 RepID=A0A4Y2B255_ARAVE|nr:hypothetical protein AVEN_34694-1 [Araneus ventricosus]